jgi:tyrosine-protein kinase Etk/Wzc
MIDKQSQEDFYSSHKEVKDLDFGKIFRFLLMQSKLIISIVLVVFAISYTYHSVSTKKYMIQSLLQYESFNQNVFDPSDSVQMASSMSGSDAANLVELYKSRTNLLKVISGLKLNININDLYEDEYIDIVITSDEKNQSSNHEIKLSFSKDGFNLLDNDLNEIQFSKYGNYILHNNLKISVNSVFLKEYRPINIYYSHPESMYNFLKGQLLVKTNTGKNSWFSNQSLITVSYITDDIELGKKIINYSNNVFFNQRIYDQNEKSRKAIDFIDKNIKSLGIAFETNKIKLKEFREKNQSLDVSLEIQAIINKIQLLDESLNSIDIEITKAKEIYTPNNPVYLNLISKKELIQRQKDEVLSEIEMMPKEQQEFIDLYNNVELSQNLFEELESRRLGFSILEASTIGDIRVIDEAYTAYIVSPRLITVFFATFIAALAACLIAIIRGFNFLPLSNPAEMFDNNIHLPIVGVIPHIDEIDSSDDLGLNSSIESLIVNINSIQNDRLDKNLITITSPTPSNGKSTISMKLSEGFANINKKVLLVDNDLKRGKIGSAYNLKSISKKTFDSINESTIHNYEVHDNFHVIPRVKGLNNTFQFLYSHEYRDKIKFFKDYFDYIIFDTGPILSVADASILIEQSDFNLLVVRHGINKMNEIKQSIDNFKQINKSIDGLIYNAYSKPKSYYGYYGIYGNYSYQYYAEKYLDEAYEYEKKD